MDGIGMGFPVGSGINHITLVILAIITKVVIFYGQLYVITAPGDYICSSTIAEPNNPEKYSDAFILHKYFEIF